MELILLKLSYRSLTLPKGTTIFGKNLIMNHTEVKKMGWTQSMLDDHDEFTDKLRMLHPDRKEFACLCALVLLTSGKIKITTILFRLVVYLLLVSSVFYF